MPLVHAKALYRAAEILGGVDALREYLCVPVGQLELWMGGRATPPVDIFLRTVDLIGGDPAPAASSFEIARAKRLRRESGFLRDAMARTRIRAEQIRAAVLHDKAERKRLGPRTPAVFLAERFDPSEGRDMVEAALDAALDAAGAQQGNLQLACPEGLRIVAQRGFGRPFLDFFALVEHGGSACGVAARENRRVVVPDVAADPIFAGTAAGEVVLQAGARAVQSTPLLGQSGELLGMLSTHYQQPRRPTDSELLGVEIVARRATFWLEGGAA